MSTHRSRAASRWRSPARVTNVRVLTVSDDQAVLTITARHEQEVVTRTMRGGAATLLHAGEAVARHYRLRSQGQGCWTCEEGAS